MGGLARDMGAIGESSHLLGSGLQLRGRLSYELGFRVIDGQMRIPCHGGLLNANGAQL